MLRGLVTKSAKLSLIEKGTTYIILFAIASYLYLHFFSRQVVFICMVFLSFIAIVASILSDNRTIRQFISTLILSGAEKRIIMFCIWVYLIVRILPILFIYILYSIFFFYVHGLALVVISHLLFMISLLHIIYKVMRL